jgi:hypothetical protein
MVSDVSKYPYCGYGVSSSFRRVGGIDGGMHISMNTRSVIKGSDTKLIQQVNIRASLYELGVRRSQKMQGKHHDNSYFIFA